MAKDILSYGLMGGVSQGIRFLLLPLLTRAFSTSEYGIVDIIATTTSLLTIAMTLSLENAVARYYYAEEKDGCLKTFISTLLFFIAAFGGIICLLMWAFSSSIAELLFEDRSLSGYIILGVLTAYFTALSNFPSLSRSKFQVLRENSG
ncbi:oligosaccharide flippase family protein [Chloroflexi bacterium TSY]|nr:oligosaccharide flippase family protein [Chloroflexi bacterium TSY]